MNKIKLVSDSSCDLTQVEIDRLNIEIVPFSISFDDTTYLRENIDITLNEFYEKMSDPNVFAKTSLPSVNLYIEAFTRALQDECDILCFTISSKLSGSYQSAVNAREIVLEDYPDAVIKIIDSEQAAIAQGLLVNYAFDLINNGKTIDQTYEIVMKNRQNITIYLTVNTLKYLQKGGRIGKVQAIAGELLNVLPIIQLKDGELLSVSKVRGNKKALSTISSLCDKFLVQNSVDKQNCNVFVYNCVEDIEPLKEKLLSDGFNDIKETKIGITIAAHTGISITGACISHFVD